MTDVCATFPAFRGAPAYDVPYCWSAVMRGPEECRCAGTPIGDANLADDAWSRALLTRYERFRARARSAGAEARRGRLREVGLAPLPAAVEITEAQPTYPWRKPNRPALVRDFA